MGFIDMLNFRGEPVFNYTDDEIDREMENIRKLHIPKGDINESSM